MANSAYLSSFCFSPCRAAPSRLSELSIVWGHRQQVVATHSPGSIGPSKLSGAAPSPLPVKGWREAAPCMSSVFQYTAQQQGAGLLRVRPLQGGFALSKKASRAWAPRPRVCNQRVSRLHQILATTIAITPPPPPPSCVLLLSLMLPTMCILGLPNSMLAPWLAHQDTPLLVACAAKPTHPPLLSRWAMLSLLL